MDSRQFTRWALGAWFVAVLAVGAAGGFVTSPDVPPLPIVAGVALPLAAFAAAYSRWGEFRSLVLSADLRLLTGIQAWRWAGLGFLFLYAYGVLPGLFALPAGLGDMAIGLTAPWMVARLASDPAFAASRRFAVWNALGILDLAVAVGLGGAASGIIPGLTSVLTTPMARLPLILIPAFLVPFFVMLHLTAFFQARRASAVRYGAMPA
jgi:hypothetical protein